MQALALNVSVLGEDGNEVIMNENDSYNEVEDLTSLIEGENNKDLSEYDESNNEESVFDNFEDDEE